MTISGRITFTQMEDVAYGRETAPELAAQAKRLGANRVFLMVSGTLNRETDEIAKVIDALGSRHAGTFDQMPAHSPRAAVVAAANAARDAGADLIATVGGGSITDAAKAVQLCLSNNVADTQDFTRLVITPGNPGDDIVPPTVRQVSAPTTLSAGEFSSISGVTNEATKTKEMLRHAGIIPQMVILDPAITRHTPEWLWLSTGIRAVDHCVEGLCSGRANPYGDAQAAKGLDLLARGLRGVKADPTDMDARLDCQLGAWLSMGPLSSGVPMGASHGIGYVLGAVYDVPHGYTSCVMLPYVMKWNKSANADRQRLVSTALGSPNDDAGDLLDALIRDLGLPRTLADVGIDAAAIGALAEGAMKTPWIPFNPRPIDGPDAAREILEMAI